MKQKKAKKTLLKGIQKVAENELSREFSRWPPDCLGLIHQPKRPCNSLKKQ